MRISSAAVGMVLLAGLAYYQGDADPTRAQQDMLTGTVLTEASRNQENDCGDAVDPAAQDAANCAEAAASDASGG